MKVKPGFILRELSGEYVVVPVGEAGRDFNGMIRLNEPGAFLWKELTNGTEEASLADKLVERYEGVSEQTARDDVREFLDSIREVLDG